MTEFNPGDGWRRLAKGERDQDEMIVYYGDEGSTSWVRVPAVPPLPTEPYTVIRVTWADIPHGAPSDWAKLAPGYWHGRLGYFQSDEELQRRITAFEVLAEPRAVTAKAVLDRVREASGWSVTAGISLSRIARDFGVPSTTPSP